jgi:hypothetical protein
MKSRIMLSSRSELDTFCEDFRAAKVLISAPLRNSRVCDPLRGTNRELVLRGALGSAAAICLPLRRPLKFFPF